MPKAGAARFLLALATALAMVASTVFVLHGGGAITSVKASDTAVTIKDYSYSPDPVTVVAGSVVTWTNSASQDHTVTSDSGTTLASGRLGAGDSYGNLFDTPGTYAYHCEIHPTQMKGTIIVTAAAATSAPSGSLAPTPPPGTLPPDFKTPIPSPEASASPPPSPLPSGGGDGTSSGSSSLLLVGVVLVLLIVGIVLYAAWRRQRPA
jgi:plastocyanin